MIEATKLKLDNLLIQYIKENYGLLGVRTYEEDYWDPPDKIELYELLKQLYHLDEEIKELANRNDVLKLPKKILQEENDRRIAEVQERKEKKLLEWKRKTNALKRNKKEKLTYIGGTSNYLLYREGTEAHKKRLQENELVEINTPEDLAKNLGINIPTLQFLCYQRRLSKKRTYQCFRVPKKTGGYREISAPIPILKEAQYWILNHIVSKLPQLPCVHGFVTGRSIVTNALPHLKKEIVINIDLQDFFPSIREEKVMKLFSEIFGYPPAVALCLSRMCTEHKYEKILLESAQESNEQMYYLGCGYRQLPQGAPTSPTIANLVAKNIDEGILQLCDEFKLNYTRYADDLTLSSDDKNIPIGKILEKIRQITQREGFTIHPKKTRIMRRGTRQEVTGIIVNEKPNVDRRTLNRFRAFLHNLEKRGPNTASWKGSTRVFDEAMGFARFVQMVHPKKGQYFVEKIQSIRQMWK